MKSKGGSPVRTCVACGKKGNKWELTRFVIDKGGHIVKDDKMTKPGRGAYACPNPVCWGKLASGEYLSRALRIKRPEIFELSFLPKK